MRQRVVAVHNPGPMAFHDSESTLDSFGDYILGNVSIGDLLSKGEEVLFTSDHCIPDYNNDSISSSSAVSFASSLSSFAYYPSEDETTEIPCCDSRYSLLHDADPSESTLDLHSLAEASLQAESFVASILQSIPSSSLSEDQEGRQKVRFGDVSVRHYPIILGDFHTVCPLQLDWEYREDTFPSVELHEVICKASFMSANGNRRPRRLNVSQRRDWVARSLGITVSQVKVLEKDLITADTVLDNMNNIYQDTDLRDSGVRQASVDRPPRRLYRKCSLE
jgi:hypothetical protein